MVTKFSGCLTTVISCLTTFTINQTTEIVQRHKKKRLPAIPSNLFII